jgi:hypothetical protein
MISGSPRPPDLAETTRIIGHRPQKAVQEIGPDMSRSRHLAVRLGLRQRSPGAGRLLRKRALRLWAIDALPECMVRRSIASEK